MKPEILSGMNYWLGVECLTPSSVPKTGPDELARTITWDVRSNAELPWIDQDKIRMMTKFKEEDSELEWSYVAYCSVLETSEVFAELRDLFRVRETGYIEFRKCDPSAAFALTLNASGFVTNTFFISSLPWAMGIMNSTPPNESFDFSDFQAVTQAHTKALADFCEETLNIVAKEADCSPPPRPIDFVDIDRLTECVYSLAKWRPKRSLPLRIQAKLWKKSSEGREKDTNLLNSFYVQDLIAISKEVGAGRAGAAFKAFMAESDPAKRIDIRKDAKTVNDGVMPSEMPLGRWPSKHQLVFAQQFAVNTIINKLTAAPGIFSVNGPPGTGKTTLLRDIVAGVIVNRARKLVTYDKPGDAFGRSLTVEGWKYAAYALDEKLCGDGIVVASANNGAIENVTKELPARDAIPETCGLRYFEGVSDSVFAGDKSKSRKKGATWGMIAAALGNKSNTYTFFDRFGPGKPWKEKDDKSPDPFLSLWDAVAAATQKESIESWDQAKRGFNAALTRAVAAQDKLDSTARKVRAVSDNEKLLPEIERRLCEAAEKAEVQRTQHKSLLVATASAKSRVATAKGICKLIICRLSIEGNLSALKEALLQNVWRKPAEVLGLNPQEVTALKRDKEVAQESARMAESRLNAIRAMKPSWLRRMLNWRAFGKWQKEVAAAMELLAQKIAFFERKSDLVYATEAFFAEITPLREQIDRTEAELSQLKSSLGGSAQTSLEEAEKEMRSSEADFQRTQAQLNAKKAELSTAEATQNRLKGQHADLNLSLRDDKLALKNLGVTETMMQEWLNTNKTEEAIQLDPPWYDTEFFEAREELFCAAIRLHHSFVVNGWQKLQCTLKALIAMNTGAISPNGVAGGAHQLWESLFLVVPVISTTFASVGRMFNGCGCESLGWLLIDEAGQATPQQALGAIWRSKRAVVVGDPLQLEPIVSLPAEVLQALERRCKAEKRFSLIESSAQVLADNANPFGTMIGLKWVGSPLRVHRRCLNPMFDISNAIAYEGMMVHGVSKESGREGWAGESCWIHIPAQNAVGNCIPTQVEKAVELVQALEKAHGLKDGEKFKTYLITPFRDVDKWLDKKLHHLYGKKKTGMHGTVHTFQGKESAVVIFVLGGNPANPGVISEFAAANANLLNVAVTRAKERVYVIGDYDQWTQHKYFEFMADGEVLPRKSEDDLNEMIMQLYVASAQATEVFEEAWGIS